MQNGRYGTAVTYEGVCKRYGDVVAVDRLDLAVDEGEMLVLLGPSGCGKTTSLRMLAGLESISAGTIRIGQTVVNDLPPRSRNIAMVFQSYALYPHMKVIDNIAYPLKIARVPTAERYARAREVANLLQIDRLLERKPRELSGGERQRVALGRAIIRRPNVFLMDEPLSNLDAKLRVHMRGELKRLHVELGVTTVYVTHDQAEALILGDRIAIMRHGVLQQVGSPKEVYDRPANIFVGGFLGSPSMNFVEGGIQTAEGRTVFQAKSFRLPMPERWRQALAAKQITAGERVVLGLRPEHISLAPQAQGEYVPAKIYVVEHLGNETVVGVELDGPVIMVRVDADFEGAIGEPIGIRFNLEKGHLFHAVTEQRLT